MTDPFLHDDAAYVLGALRGDELAAFEAHLAGCADCRARVAEIEPMAHVLADLTVDDLADPVGADAGPPDTLLPALRARIRSERRRRWATTAIGAAAAAAVLTAGLVLWTGRDSSSPPPALAMTALVSSPVHATARLDNQAWGTRITLSCRYDLSYPNDVEYGLVVTDRAGAKHDAGSWRLAPNGTTHFTGGTAVRRTDIARVDITAGDIPILELVP